MPGEMLDQGRISLVIFLFCSYFYKKNYLKFNKKLKKFLRGV